MNNILSNLKLNYKNLKKSLQNRISKISNRSKEANKHPPKSAIDPKTAIIHEQIQIETLSAICPGNNIYDKAAETSYSIDVYWCERGLALSDLGQFENALESYKRALEINPRSFKALNNRANVLYRIGRYDEAIDDFRKALEINPQLIDAWCGMGNAMSKLGRYKVAVSAYE
ncbi:MAG: tetratricopeptide repeat protein, partial [Methanothrix sp.]